MSNKKNVYILPLIILVTLFLVGGAAYYTMHEGGAPSLFPPPPSPASGPLRGSNCVTPDLSKIPRCQDIGGDDMSKASTYKDATTGTTVQGCKGNEGSGKDVSLCSGSGNDSICKVTTDKINKLKTYYGKSSSGEVDNSTQYYKDVQTIMSKAKQKIQNMVKSGYFACLKNKGVTPAVMFDQDDTIWSTWYEDNVTKFKYDGDMFNKIANKKFMPTITPVFKFINYLNSVGAKPIFVTGRPANALLAKITSHQLDNIPLTKGTDYWGGDDVGDGNKVQSKNGVFMHSGDGKGAASVYKELTRCWIQKNPSKMGGQYKFVMSVGDQWSDSNGNCAGIRVKLPNAMYYLP